MSVGIKIEDLAPEDKGRSVCRVTSYKEPQKGKIKSWNRFSVFVVYDCNGDWDNYKEYTGQATNPDELVWSDEL